MAKGFHPYKVVPTPMQSNTREANNNSSTGGHTNSARSGLSLPLNQMAIPMYTAQTREDVDVGGQVLLQNFLREEFEHEGLSEDALSDVEIPPIDEYGDGPELYQTRLFRSPASSGATVTSDSFRTEDWIHIGGNIRQLADQFAESTERDGVRQQANRVDLEHINRDGFFSMLNETFLNGINRYCIVALFYFCSDVLIRCVRQEMTQQGRRLFLWFMEFLIEKVCSWVYDNGGWERVFSNIYNVVFKISAIVALGVVISCGFVWMRRNW